MSHGPCLAFQRQFDKNLEALIGSLIYGHAGTLMVVEMII